MIFWTSSDAEHDRFFRTWKGPLTEEAAKKLRGGDFVYATSACLGNIVTLRVIEIPPERLFDGSVFLSKSEAKAAVHDLWLADRHENQMEAITEEQAKSLKAGDTIYILRLLIGLPYKVEETKCDSRLDSLFISGELAYFSEEAANAMRDRLNNHTRSSSEGDKGIHDSGDMFNDPAPEGDSMIKTNNVKGIFSLNAVLDFMGLTYLEVKDAIRRYKLEQRYDTFLERRRECIEDMERILRYVKRR